jgi:hypothetical protein
MNSSFERRGSTSNLHDLWIELERVESAIEERQATGSDSDNGDAASLMDRQKRLRDALARLNG